MDLIYVVITALTSSGAVSLIMYMITRHDKKVEAKSGMQAALRLLLKQQLKSMCVKYIEQEWIYEDELEDIISMHEMYHDVLGGNGYLDTLMSKVKALDIHGVGV